MWVGLSWLSCGAGLLAGVVCRGGAWVDTGRTTLSFHGEAGLTGGMLAAAGTFTVTRWLFVAWLM
jgi:hypothetical protein